MDTPTDATAFDILLKQSRLNGQQRKSAWDIFKTAGYLQAAEYVQKTEAELPPPSKAIAIRGQALPYRVWGHEHIDEASFEQMDNAMRLPVSVAGALMPDAHKGYGLPIGGVLATENAVIPYAEDVRSQTKKTDLIGQLLAEAVRLGRLFRQWFGSPVRRMVLAYRQ